MEETLSEHWPDPLLASLKEVLRSERELRSEHWPDSLSLPSNYVSLTTIARANAR